jgi:DNA-directed RNA polymerase subunit RPC12/RpoP
MSFTTRTRTKISQTEQTQQEDEDNPRKCIDCSAIIPSSEPSYKIRCVKCWRKNKALEDKKSEKSNKKQKFPEGGGRVLGS